MTDAEYRLEGSNYDNQNVFRVMTIMRTRTKIGMRILAGGLLVMMRRKKVEVA